MHSPPLGRRASLHSSFPFPSPNNKNPSLFPQQPPKFIFCALPIQTNPLKTPPLLTPSPPQALNLDPQLTKPDGFFPVEQNPSSHPLQHKEKRHRNPKRSSKLPVQDLAGRIKNGRFETISEFNHLFMELVIADEVELAFRLYSALSSYGLSADSFTFSILIHCYCNRNEPTEAKRVLEHMIGNGFDYPKVTTFTQLINSFCRKGRLKQAFEVFGIMGRVQCEPTINTYNCLLKGLCYVGRVEEAYRVLSNIKKSWTEPEAVTSLEPDMGNAKIKKSWKKLDGKDREGMVFEHAKGKLKPDVYTYTAVMDGFCKVGRSDEAKELLDEAIEMGLTPSMVTYNTLFNGYFKEGRPMEGFCLLRLMKERNCSPDNICYSTLLHGLLQWGEIHAAARVYKEMEEIGFKVDERMMNTLLRGLCRRSRKEKELLKDAYKLFDKMSSRGCIIDPCAHELMIEAFCNGKDMDKAFVNLCEIVRMGLSPTTFTLDIVIRGLCIEGKIEKALSLLVLVYRRKIGMPGRVALDVLINEMNQQGLVISAASVYCAALKSGVVPMRKPQQG